MTSRYNRQFVWMLFLVLPLAISVFWISQDWSRLWKVLDFRTRGPYMAIISLIFGFRALRLLKTMLGLRKKLGHKKPIRRTPISPRFIRAAYGRF